MADKPQIVIIGGGVGSMTAAYQLSRGAWQERFAAITLYQQGWRLGGKGASGRGPGLRIEEHGLHIWFGFYENAFRMLHRCHLELDQLERQGIPRWPLACMSVEASFRPCTEISLTDYDGCCWKLWTADFFDFTDDRPWLEPDPRPPGEQPDDWSVAFYASRCLHLAADLATSLLASEGIRLERTPAPVAGDGGFDAAADALWDALSGDLHGLLRAAGRTFDALSAEVVEEPIVLETLDLVMQALEIALDFLRGRYDRLVRANDGVRRAWYIVDIMVAIVRGLIEDDVIAADDFDIVNDVDFRDWLLTHGAHRDSVDCALVRTVVYDLAFGYRGGDPQRPAAEAGTALRGLLRTFFTYRGALMWKMNAGMGDVVFAPLYELLVKRGVEVKFFHRVEAVRASGRRVEEIEVDVQARLPPDTTAALYLRPRLGSEHDATDPAVWPSDPRPLLSDCGRIPIPEVEPNVYESWYTSRDATRVDTKVLRRGERENGFDLVVFGLPISCVPHIAPDLPAVSERWRRAVDNIETVPTQALQLWLRQPAPALCDTEPGIVVGGFTEPFDTWADMHHLITQETVPGSLTVAYFCNVLADSEAPPRGEADGWLAEQDDLVRAHALRFLSYDVASIWPKATKPTREFDWRLLVADSDAAGQARLDKQFRRANIEPSERYVLSVPGSSACRIEPDDTDFTNLFVAGDWTACTLNAGCVEAAVISGMVAANGIFRSIGDDPAEQQIIGRRGP